MVVSSTMNAQTVNVSTTIQLDSLFLSHPYATAHVYSDPHMKTRIMIENYETFNRIWDFQRKQTKEMVIGLSIGAVGVAGMIKAVNMPIPVRQVNNPELDEKADKAQRDRRIVGAASIFVGAVGAVVFVHSFRWTKRLKADIGYQSLKLEYNLTGKRNYYNKVGSHPKKLKDKW